MCALYTNIYINPPPPPSPVSCPFPFQFDLSLGKIRLTSPALADAGLEVRAVANLHFECILSPSDDDFEVLVTARQPSTHCTHSKDCTHSTHSTHCTHSTHSTHGTHCTHCKFSTHSTYGR